MSISTCRSCADPIRWATTVDGKRMPLDVDPIVGGNVRLDGSTARPVAVVLDQNTQADAARAQRPLFVSHFVTCPAAKQWRGGKR